MNELFWATADLFGNRSLLCFQPCRVLRAPKSENMVLTNVETVVKLHRFLTFILVMLNNYRDFTFEVFCAFFFLLK